MGFGKLDTFKMVYSGLDRKKEITMEIKRQHENGQILEALKSYEELSAEEKTMLVFPKTNKVEDYATFRVDYNKGGVLRKVTPQNFSQEKIDEIENGNDLVDMFKSVEKLIKEKNVDQDYARACAIKSVLGELHEN